MAQTAKIVDLTKSFIPIDGRVFPENLYVQKAEDSPVDTAPIVAYQGYNFLPTSYGYKSYFGTNSALGIDALTSKVDKIFIFQTPDYVNILVALCEDGIWTKDADTAGAWDHQVVLTIPDEAIRYDWTYCVIEKGLYCYRATGEAVYFLHPDKNLFFVSIPCPTINAVSSTYASAGMVPNGTYEYYFAVKLVSGNFTEKSNVVSVTVSGGPALVVLTLTTDISTYSLLRVYRKTVATGVIIYKDLPTGSSVIISDTNQWNEVLASFPDYVGMTEGVDAAAFRSFTPTFLNMVGQHGIFRSGQRLGFWDSENSVAWSSIDDLSDFTPSIETLAGSAIFGDVTGRITNILPHGEGFIIYAKGSIVWIRRDVSATFQWNPLVVLSNGGVAFPEEVIQGTPDTIHYAWTTVGLYKITDGQPTIIVPEVADFLKEQELPVFLELLEGRYLCLQLLDPDYVDGKVVLSTSSIDPITLTLPNGADVDNLPSNPIILTGSDACNTMSLGSFVHGTQGAIQDLGLPGGSSAAKKAGVNYTPVYKAYFSQAGCGDPDNITWGANPCSVSNLGTSPDPYPMSPITQLAGKLSYATQNTTNKIDAGTSWDPIQFYQAQIAIWEAGNKKRKSFLQKILSRQNSKSIESIVGSCSALPTTEFYCELGDWIADVSDPHWGINECSFWVTRYITAKMHIQTYSAHTITCTPRDESIPPTIRGFCEGSGANNYDYSSAQACAQQVLTSYAGGDPAWYYVLPDDRGVSTPFCQNFAVRYSGGNGNAYGFFSWTRDDTCPSGYHGVNIAPNIGFHSAAVAYTECIPDVLTYDKVESWNARNIGELKTGAFGVDTGLLILVGWNRRNSDGSTTFVAKTSETCSIPNQSTPPGASSSSGIGGNGFGGLPIDAINGSICGTPFDPVDIDGLDLGVVNWPDFTITFPGDTFLLQEGSIGPKYPDIYGALVYDTHLKKWGKLKNQYKRLLNYSPINTTSGGIIPYSTFGIKAGLIKDNGFIYLFDKYPSKSYITYGKIGYKRLGFTDVEEVIVNFKEPSEGILRIEGSLDGHNLESFFSKSQSFVNVNTVTAGCNFSARWFNLTISGIFDLTHLEFRGTRAGRR